MYLFHFWRLFLLIAIESYPRVSYHIFTIIFFFYIKYIPVLTVILNKNLIFSNMFVDTFSKLNVYLQIYKQIIHEFCWLQEKLIYTCFLFCSSWFGCASKKCGYMCRVLMDCQLRLVWGRYKAKHHRLIHYCSLFSFLLLRYTVLLMMTSL